MKKFWSENKFFISFLICILLISNLFVYYVAQIAKVSGASMESNFYDGERLLVDKLSYKIKEVKRFDVVIFPSPVEKNKNYIKRVIGLPGETVFINTNGDIYINGKILEEKYGKETIFLDNRGICTKEIKLKENEYFVLGDNRNHSMDSRVFGPVFKNELTGKVIMKLSWKDIWTNIQLYYIKKIMSH